MNTDSVSMQAKAKTLRLERFTRITALTKTVALMSNLGRSSTLCDSTDDSSNTYDFRKDFAQQPTVPGAICNLSVRVAEVIAVSSDEGSPTCATYRVLANPRDHTNDETIGQSDSVILTGKSSWGEVKSDPFRRIRMDLQLPNLDIGAQQEENTKTTLQSHIATIADALNNFHEQTPELLLCYIACCCWRKMQARLTHWPSISLIWQISQVSRNDLEDKARELSREELRSTHPPLLFKLPISDIEAILGSALVKYSLRRAHTSESVFPQYRKLQVLNPDRPLEFTPETCWEFHTLFLGCILHYGESLQRLREAFQDRVSSGAEEPAKSIAIVLPLLESLVYSEPFHLYLQSLVRTNRVRFPKKSDMENKDCWQFSQYNRRASDPSESLPVSSGHPILPSPSFAVSDYGEQVHEGEDDDDDDDQSIRRRHKNEYVLLRNIMRVHVLYPFSVTTLCDARRRRYREPNPTKIKINLLAIRGPPKLKIGDWRLLIPSPAKAGLPPNIIQSLEMLLPANYSQKTIGATIHCETALATLPNYPSPEDITVSKLCCIPCRKVLSIVAADSRFGALRQHHSMYAVALPPWLPLDVVEKMIEYFEGILVKELRVMVGTAMAPSHTSQVISALPSSTSFSSSDSPPSSQPDSPPSSQSSTTSAPTSSAGSVETDSGFRSAENASP